MKQSIFSFFIFALAANLSAQVNIGSQNDPQIFSILELNATNQGLRLPQLTIENRKALGMETLVNPIGEEAIQLANAAKGLVIYNATSNCLEFWNGSEWISLGAANLALITQEEANGIALEYLNKKTQPYSLYAKKSLQTKISITTLAGEQIEPDYPCWVYFINNINYGHYLIVNANNGNLIDEKTNAEPEDLADWRKITPIPYSNWKLLGIVDAETGVFTDLDSKDCECYYTLEFDKQNASFTVYTSDEKFKPKLNVPGMSNDEELNQIFKDFCVMRYYQVYQGSQNVELQNYYKINLSGDVDTFENLLREKNFFEEINRTNIYIPGTPPDGSNKISTLRGVNFFSGNVYYLIDYTLSMIQFGIIVPEDSSSDEKEYLNALCNAQTFELKNSELKIYYNDKMNYLLFKRR